MSGNRPDDEEIWRGPGDLVVHCVHCDHYPEGSRSLKEPGHPYPNGHPSCVVVRPGESIPVQFTKGPWI